MTWKLALDLQLPYPPSGNRLWRKFRGRQVLSQEARRYQEEVAAVWWQERIRGRKGIGSQDCRVQMVAYPPDRRCRDLDNLIKPLIDALKKAGIMEDDRQVRKIEIGWGGCRSGGLVRVRIWVPPTEKGFLR